MFQLQIEVPTNMNLVADWVTAGTLVLTLLFGGDVLHRYLFKTKLEVRLREPQIIQPKTYNAVEGEIRFQAFQITARNGNIHNLKAKVKFKKEATFYLTWTDPLVGFKPKVYVGIGMPEEHTALTDTRTDLARDQEEQLAIWKAYKEESLRVFMFNADRIVSWNDEEIKALDGAELTVQFISEEYTDKVPRKFVLHTSSWQELKLEEVH